MIIHGTSFHFPRPTHDKRDSYTTFITLALQATQFSVTTKNSGSALLFMRAIITTKYYYCVFIQPFSFSFASISPTYVSKRVIIPANSACVCTDGLYLPSSDPPQVLSWKNFFLIMFQYRIIGLNQFSMRKRVGKNP